MNLKDTDLENKRKQAIEALVADSTTLAVRLLKASDFEITCYHLRHHAQLAQDVVKLLPDVEAVAAVTKPDRFGDALRAVIRRELCDILGKAGEEA